MGTRVLPDMYTLIPRACGPRDSGVHIRQNTRAHVTTIKCNTLTPQIKGKRSATNLMFPFALGQHHDVALSARATS